MCGLRPLPGRRRSWCSDECVRIWWLATDSNTALRELVALHGHRCWECGRSWEPTPLQPYDVLGHVCRPPRGAPYCMLLEYGPPSPRQVMLEVEHVRPLWALTDEQRLELRWWLPFNLQLLCTRCHKAKTRREAADRAQGRLRERVQVAGVEQLELVPP